MNVDTNHTRMLMIEGLTKRYAAARERLADDVRALNAAVEEAQREYLPSIKRHVANVRDAEAALRSALEANPQLFQKPRTITVQGVKVGFQKGKGKVVFKDGEKVVELIRKHFPDKVDQLVITEEKPNKETIATLDVDELKKLGCSVIGTDDQVVIKDTTSEIEKLIAALLAEDEEVEA